MTWFDKDTSMTHKLIYRPMQRKQAYLVYIDSSDVPFGMVWRGGGVWVGSMHQHGVDVDGHTRKETAERLLKKYLTTTAAEMKKLENHDGHRN